MIDGSITIPFSSPDEKACRSSNWYYGSDGLLDKALRDVNLGSATEGHGPDMGSRLNLLQLPDTTNLSGYKESKAVGSHLALGSHQKRLRNEVDFTRFCHAYWNHFNEVFTKDLDASVVYTEILSIIKGSARKFTFYICSIRR